MDTGSQAYMVVGKQTLARYTRWLRQNRKADVPRLTATETSNSLYRFGRGSRQCIATMLVPSASFSTPHVFDGDFHEDLRVDVVDGDLPFVAGPPFCTTHRISYLPLARPVIVHLENPLTPLAGATALQVRELQGASYSYSEDGSVSSMWLSLAFRKWIIAN